MDAKHIINATVENQPAVLSRIVGLFSGRGYNIETLNVGPCADPRFSRMTITVPGDEHVLEQVTKQLNKLVDVVKVVDLTAEKHIERELVLVEVGAPKQKRPEVLEIADVFHAEIVGVRETTVTMQFVGREDEVDRATLEEAFAALSLEYKLYNINQVKSFSKYLNAIRCFYTDRPVDFDMLRAFEPWQVNLFAPMEHERWIREHISMGWIYGDVYENEPDAKALREQLRMHKLAMDGNPTRDEIFAHYAELPLSEREKDFEPFNSMLKLIKKFDGLRIYKLD